MPENDMEELAENFFCHMHDHNHNHSEDIHEHSEHSGHADLTDELNPLRNVSKLRKSILSARTFFILNTNHIGSVSTETNGDLICTNCSQAVGFKSILIIINFVGHLI